MNGLQWKDSLDRRRGAVVESRLKMPIDNEVVGRVMRIAGATNFIKCNDGKERLCTIPGRLRRMFWIRELEPSRSSS